MYYEGSSCEVEPAMQYVQLHLHRCNGAQKRRGKIVYYYGNNDMISAYSINLKS